MSEKIYKCDCCGTEGKWAKGWSSWGSYLLTTEGFYLIACNPGCHKTIDDNPDMVWREKYDESIEQTEKKVLS